MAGALPEAHPRTLSTPTHASSSLTSSRSQGQLRGGSPRAAGGAVFSPRSSGETRVQQAASSILAMLQRNSGPLVESQIRCTPFPSWSTSDRNTEMCRVCPTPARLV